MVDFTAEEQSKPVKAVIFDCDGVIVDSIRGHSVVELQELQAQGIQVTNEQLLENAGKPFAVLARKLADEQGIVLPANFLEVLAVRKMEYFSANLKAMPGMREALEELGDMPRCIASGSPLEGVVHSVETVGLIKYFDKRHIFSSDMVAEGKPSPLLFELAARELGVPPENCAVIEDAGSGIKGAVAAHMTPFGFDGGDHCTKGHAEKLKAAGAVRVFSHMKQLPSLLAAYRIG